MHYCVHFSLCMFVIDNSSSRHEIFFFLSTISFSLPQEHLPVYTLIPSSRRRGGDKYKHAIHLLWWDSIPNKLISEYYNLFVYSFVDEFSCQMKGFPCPAVSLTIVVCGVAVKQRLVSGRGALLLQGAAHQLHALFHHPYYRSGRETFTGMMGCPLT